MEGGTIEVAEPRLPPGPKIPPALQAILLLGSPGWWKRLQRRYGDRFTVRIAGFGTVVYLVDPADIRSVFRGDDETYHAGEANGLFLKEVLGHQSVLVTDEDKHRDQRRLMTGPFHGKAVARLEATMAELAAADIDAWPVGHAFPVIKRTRSITFEVILQTVIGVRDPKRADAFRRVLPAVANMSGLMMLQFVMPSLQGHWPWNRYVPLEGRVNDLLREEIELCRSDPDIENRHDVLAMLVQARYPDGSGMSTSELRDQLMTLLMAGHETTATGLAWLLERLVRNPDVLAKAVRAADSGDDAYLEAVVNESLRSRPIVPDVSRRLTKTVSIGDYVLPPLTFVEPAIYLVHRDARFYSEPEAFNPERFLGEHPDPAVWLPFGGGVRRCLGATFALTEMKIVLREVLRRLDLAPTTARPERVRVRHVTYAPHRGGRITVRQRRRTAAASASVAHESLVTGSSRHQR